MSRNNEINILIACSVLCRTTRALHKYINVLFITTNAWKLTVLPFFFFLENLQCLNLI